MMQIRDRDNLPSLTQSHRPVSPRWSPSRYDQKINVALTTGQVATASSGSLRVRRRYVAREKSGLILLCWNPSGVYFKSAEIATAQFHYFYHGKLLEIPELLPITALNSPSLPRSSFQISTPRQDQPVEQYN